MISRQPISNVDLTVDSYDRTVNTVPQYTADVVARLKREYVLTCDHLEQIANIASTWYNKRVHEREFAVGDTVRIYSPMRSKGRSPKWQSFYKDFGTSQEKLNVVTYIVKCAAWKHNKVVHVDKLKPVLEFQ
jgi:KaiC/GvpD/RAD55 family RecA-like ATPase